MTQAILLGLVASASWGVADFLGGLQSRVVPVVLVICVVQGTGLALAVVAVVATSAPLPDGGTTLLAGSAGLAAAAGFLCFMRALAIGSMSIVAPISATGVVLPVVIGWGTGDRLSTIVALGTGLAVLGVVLAAQEGDGDDEAAAGSRASILLALLSAIGIGATLVLTSAAASQSVLWLLVLSRVVSVPGLALYTWKRGIPRPPRPRMLMLVVTGVLSVGATASFALATTKGALSVVAVVSSLYPVVTVALARTVLKERIEPVQLAGVAAALIGVALVTAG